VCVCVSVCLCVCLCVCVCVRVCVCVCLIISLSLGTLSFNVTLPIGVQAATIVVPKPVAAGKFAARVVVRERGQVLWDGEKLVGPHLGIQSGTSLPDGVAFAASNGVYFFETSH
jgi:hypothetical protein